MEKTVKLVLKSEHCEETIEISAALWEKFEQRAQELEIAVEELFPMVLDRFIKDPNLKVFPSSVWVKDTYWRKLDEPKRCRFIGGHPKTHCPNNADFGLLRSNGIWAYCEEHMYGRRIRDGIVEVEVHPDSSAAKEGHV